MALKCISVADDGDGDADWLSVGPGWTASGWTSDPPSYSADYKTPNPNESYPTYPIQYATPYSGLQQQNVVIVQPHVNRLS